MSKLKSVSGARVLMLGMILPLASCSNPPPPSDPSTEVESDAGFFARGGAGLVSGNVLFEGTLIPQSTRVENTTDPEACGRLHSLGNIVISPENRGIKNVIVALKDVVLPNPDRLEAGRLILDNRDCEFQPHVAVLTTGSRLETVNSDPVSHSVHFYGSLSRNLSLGPSQSKVIQRVPRPGLHVVKCDIHGWMQAYIRVDPHPFHAVTENDGSFQIRNVPAGSYQLETWHEHFGTKELNVSVTAGTSSQVTVYYRDESS